MKFVFSAFKQRFTPLDRLLLIGLFFRLISVVFSKGFGWHDDHFLIIEAAQSWVDGDDYNNWLPSENDPSRVPQGHSFFYVGIHFIILKLLAIIGMVDPQFKMMVIRFIHALWSLLIIKYGYKIALQNSNERTAWYVGLFLAVFWFMPFVSVRNLVEFVCVPPILMAIHLLNQKQVNWKNFFLAGIILGIAFSIRFQTIFISGGIGIALLMRRNSFKNSLITVTSFFLVLMLTQGLIDFLIWNKPFAEFLAYVQYNLDNASVYGTNNWHMYFDLIFGLLIPPMSFILFAGYFYNWKRYSMIFWSVMIYLLFHTYFPNKQERFIMTILPLIIISGTDGMILLYDKYKSGVSSGLVGFFKYFVIVLNTILLFALSFSSSKLHRVNAMYYLYKKGDAKNILIEDSNKEEDFLLPPLFYYGQWIHYRGITKKFTADSALAYYRKQPEAIKPNYVIFWQAENIESRVDSLKKRFPTLSFETTIEPSLIDKTLHVMNPLNDNHTAFIYRIN